MEVSFEPAYSVWNASISYATAGEGLLFTVYAKNALDEEYRVYNLELHRAGVCAVATDRRQSIVPMVTMNVFDAERHTITGSSAAALRALQLDRLKWSLHHAYDNVEHYRRAFDAAGVHPKDLQCLEDLARFPFLTKQDFRTNYPFGLFAVPREKIARRKHAPHGKDHRTLG